MPYEFGKDWNKGNNQTVELTEAEIVELIKNMKVTVTGKTRGASAAADIANGLEGNQIANKVTIDKGMHPDKNGYLHITIEYYFEKYHLYAARNGASAGKSVNGLQIMVVSKLANVYNDPFYNDNMAEAKIAKQ